MTVISYPTPIYSNPAINPEYYQPSKFNISAITQGVTTTITTSIDHNFVVGQRIRILIQPTDGTRQLNNYDGIVFSIPADNQVNIKVDSRNFNTFISGGSSTPSQILAIGDINSGIIATNGINNSTTNIPGSFINIS